LAIYTDLVYSPLKTNESGIHFLETVWASYDVNWIPDKIFWRYAIYFY
jgi:hypothetical protein